MPKKINLLFKLLGLYLIVAVVFSIPFFQRYLINKEVKNTKQIQTASTITGKPIKITIPIAGIDLTIINGDYNKTSKSWTLSPSKALFATVSSFPNNKEGNTLIYGHNTNAVFYSTYKLIYGDEAFIYTDSGHTFIYKLVNSEIVKPTDTLVFDYQGKPRLTLQTCNGLFSENRKLFYFDLEKVI